MSELKRVLESVKDGAMSVDEALSNLKWAPFEDLGFARLDTHRSLRKGVPEVIYAAGKSAEQVVLIMQRLLERHSSVMATRVTEEQWRAVSSAMPDAVLHASARIIEARTHPRLEPPPDAPYILVVSAGTSDQPVSEEAAVTAEILGSRVKRLYDCGVAGLHRILSERDLLSQARCIVVVAGMEGALPSVVGGLVEQPVIAVPTSVGYGASFQGLSALLGMLNTCASGVTVVNIDNGFGAGYFAHLLTRI